MDIIKNVSSLQKVCQRTELSCSLKDLSSYLIVIVVVRDAASGEPPLLLAVSVHCATRAAIKEARNQVRSWKGLEGSDSIFQLDVPATMPVVKTLCGLDNVDLYLQSLMSSS